MKPAKRLDKRPSRTLLDASLHHEALKALPEGERRGRPDLVHFFLLLGLDSALNKKGGLTLLVHTRNDELIRIAPQTRIMRNYNRFVGLAEQVFREKHVPAKEPLITLESGWSLERVVKEALPQGVHVAALKEGPSHVAPGDWVPARAKASRELAVVIGGFPKGDFRSDVAGFTREVVSFGAEALTVWTIEMELIAHWEAATGVFG